MRKYTMVTIVILSQRLMSWKEEFVTFGMSVQQFLPRLEAVEAKEGGSIKTAFG